MPKREKMTIEHRAKQFLPFTALPELEVAIEEKNRRYFDKLECNNVKPQLSNLNRIFEELVDNKNSVIQIKCLDSSETTIVGRLESFDSLEETITVNTEKIPISQIKEIKIIR